MDTQLGGGSYGKVKQVAIKEFKELNFAIQEFACLKYLSDCKYIVKVLGCDLFNRTMTTELYDCSGSKTIKCTKKKDGGYNFTPTLDKKQTLKVIKCVLKGLAELHDRDMVHGDVKPCNILILKAKSKAVLCDLGFSSISKYAKATLGTATHRDPKCSRDQYSDLYSLGVCMIEMFGGVIHHTPETSPLLYIDKVEERGFKDWVPIIKNLLSSDRKSRYSARTILKRMYNKTLPQYEPDPKILRLAESRNNEYGALRDYIGSITVNEDVYTEKDEKYLRTDKHTLHRNNKLFHAIAEYIDRNDVPKEMHKAYALMGCVICCCLFMSRFRYYVVKSKHLSKEEIGIINNLVNDDRFISLLFVSSNS